MDAHRHALLDALDATRLAAYQEALSVWHLRDSDSREPQPTFQSLKWRLINIATQRGVTVNDVVCATLGHTIRPTLPGRAEDLVAELSKPEREELENALSVTWPASTWTAPIVQDAP